jgi:hypothetical protein
MGDVPQPWLNIPLRSSRMATSCSAHIQADLLGHSRMLVFVARMDVLHAE